MTERQTRCGFVALLGAPNAGKSTLLNALVGQKISIVTQKVQTTRTRIRGIAIEGDAQLVYVDTPGIFAPKRRLDRAMVAAAWGAADADVVCLLVDAKKPVIGIMITFAMAYEVMTQAMSSMVTPRLPDICDNATLTMLVSTNSITAADTVVSTMIKRAKPFGVVIEEVGIRE